MFSKEEAKEVYKVLLSNKVNYHTGNIGKKFELTYAKYIGTKYALSFSNGTLALDAALNSLNIQAGDEVIVTCRTYIASVSSIINCGAKPVFVDVGLDSQNIIPDLINRKITKKTKAIVCVHLAGMPCEMDKIKKISRKHSLFIIEDCSQAHGAKYKSNSVGSIGDIGTWSFCNDKIISTAGEGGMVTFNKKSLYDSLWSFRDHGKSNKKFYKKNKNNKFVWLHDGFGTNARLTEIQSAIGLIQLKKLKSWNKKRKENFDRIDSVLNKFVAIRIVKIPDYVRHAYYKYYAFVIPNKLKKGWSRDKILNEINVLGVNCFTGTCPEVYLENAFKKTNILDKQFKRLPNAMELGETSLMFEVHPTLREKDIKRTLLVINKVMSKASDVKKYNGKLFK